MLDKVLSDDVMKKIASENHLSETAFIYKSGDNYNLRWFTPSFEIDLCGHATLASAYVVFNYIEYGINKINFDTVSGVLSVVRKENLYEMTFPKRIAQNITPTSDMIELLGFKPFELYSERDLYAVMNDEQEVRNYIPDYTKLKRLNFWLGIVITARGNSVDFVSRYFCPELRMEDPVTGSSHSTLIPLWYDKLGKKKLLARQLSERGGTLHCENCKYHVKISGSAVIYSTGCILI